MFNVLADINWLSFAVALAVSIVLAGVWFAAVIAKPYLVALGRENEPAPQSDLVRNLGPLVCTLIVTLTTAVLVEALDITSTGDAVVFGLIIGIGYLSAMTFQIALNPNFPRPLYYGLLNAPYFVVSAVASSVILVVMR
ncbi:hypothetical protein ASE01_08410 [Nocardioides sp. Root190]|uniref:DUF1761 domain-containing protein n=1 Tax=Nocardioides sp. Root190 TaxID=1736488 RepID=UPI0006FE2393|nr:DUF1761 domain-containing protein [Nocardioides sp. Root190]KRB78166.1 hypothetical protein ASE01_08410 [Nocardioides sp. Root190]